MASPKTATSTDAITFASVNPHDPADLIGEWERQQRAR